MDWNELISPELVFLVAFVYVVGVFLKKLPAFRAEWCIPLVLWGLGIVSAILVLAIQLGQSFSPATILTGVVQGTFIAALAVFGNQVFKQITQGRQEDAEK
jgi:uncharacterized membrane protein